MASPSSEFPNSAIPQHQFKAFHNIDRTLFTRLVLGLQRDPAESMQVMAFWLWLEQSGQASNLVHKMLSMPLTLVNALADEAVLCLTCIASDESPLSLEHSDVPWTKKLTEDGVSLRLFHEHRLSAIRGVMMNVNGVCARAFDDILEHNKGIGQTVSHPMWSVFYYDSEVGANYGMTLGALIASQRRVLGDEIGEVLSQIRLGEEENEIVPEDDRTIFLTFSKGYPISKDEVRDYFTKSYGECIEAIHMQEVEEEEQPLYARLVLNFASDMDVILDHKSKAKFTINGKHVWARKFVPKSPSPLSLSRPPLTASWQP